jgi:glutamate carboxypeptidase
MLKTLAAFVRAESPSDNKSAVDYCGQIVAAEFRKRGAKIEFSRQKHRGDHLLIRLPRPKQRPKGRILLLGHIDTVYDVGMLTKMPFRISAGRAWGPATFDMKGGIVLALAALDALKACGIEPTHETTCLWNTDEEIGAESSRALIEREARRSDAVFVLEPSGEPSGAIKTSRKAVGEIEIHVTGRAAHAGLRPEDGINAVEELAAQIQRIKQWDNPKRGTRIHATVFNGGTRSNVIAAAARAIFDVRATYSSEIAPLEKRFRSLKPILRGAKLKISGGFSRPPLERKMSAALYAQAKELSAAMGRNLPEMAAGGGSDGNLTAAVGTPTLDGLGAIGAGAHSTRENIIIRELAPRAALIAGLLATLSA